MCYANKQQSHRQPTSKCARGMAVNITPFIQNCQVVKNQSGWGGEHRSDQKNKKTKTSIHHRVFRFRRNCGLSGTDVKSDGCGHRERPEILGFAPGGK